MENRKGMEYEARGQRERERRATLRHGGMDTSLMVSVSSASVSHAGSGMCGRCSNEAGGWRMAITIHGAEGTCSTWRSSSFSALGHRRRCACRLAWRYRVRLPRRHALDPVWGTSAPQLRVGLGVGVVAFVRAAVVIVGECASSVSTSFNSPFIPPKRGARHLGNLATFISHPALDHARLYHALLRLIARIHGPVDCRARCASFASSGCALAALLWCTRWIPRRRR
ncbi:hypothetical protein C8R45DRAFT_1031635 [Mycena sanguinolenta]|nr:hypothetical protein C8R45DRAFT_1031635 [Mycena sanguinolenta]